jgi:hypothetical protein
MFKATTHQSIARWVLVWFALFIGVAIASPILNPTETQMVCTSAGGMKMVVAGSDDSALDKTPIGTNMDCPLCAPVAVPLLTCTISLEKPSKLAHALHPVAAALIASLTAPPLPSRGPPAIS